MKILIADDHALFRAGLREVVTRLDEEVVVMEVANHDDAVSVVTQQPDLNLALIDLVMPRRGACTVLGLLATRSLTVPIVVLSASEDRRQMREVLDAGAMGFIPKSTLPDVVLGALRLVLAGGVYVPPVMLTHDVPQQDCLLTSRQRDILRYLVEGRPNRAICDDLGISLSTVKSHIAAIFRVLNVADRTHAAAAARRLGLIDSSSGDM